MFCGQEEESFSFSTCDLSDQTSVDFWGDVVARQLGTTLGDNKLGGKNTI
jgi:hypothetical protein